MNISVIEERPEGAPRAGDGGAERGLEHLRAEHAWEEGEESQSRGRRSGGLDDERGMRWGMHTHCKAWGGAAEFACRWSRLPCPVPVGPDGGRRQRQGFLPAGLTRKRRPFPSPVPPDSQRPHSSQVQIQDAPLLWTLSSKRARCSGDRLPTAGASSRRRGPLRPTASATLSRRGPSRRSTSLSSGYRTIT